MPETAESHAATLTTNRNCVIEVTNITSAFCLANPQVHMESGFAYSPPGPTIRFDVPEVFSFTKDDHTASGAVGVFTYELQHMHSRSCNEVIAVMFSVPFDYNIYKNWLAVGIFEIGRACDGKLFDEMYKGTDFTNFVRQEANGSGVVYRGRFVDVRACMSDEGRAIIKLELYDKIGK